MWPQALTKNLRLGPALGQAASYQHLIVAGFHKELIVFRFVRN